MTERKSFSDYVTHNTPPGLRSKGEAYMVNRDLIEPKTLIEVYTIESNLTSSVFPRETRRFYYSPTEESFSPSAIAYFSQLRSGSGLHRLYGVSRFNDDGSSESIHLEEGGRYHTFSFSKGGRDHHVTFDSLAGIPMSLVVVEGEERTHITAPYFKRFIEQIENGEAFDFWMSRAQDKSIDIILKANSLPTERINIPAYSSRKNVLKQLGIPSGVRKDPIYIPRRSDRFTKKSIQEISGITIAR